MMRQALLLMALLTLSSPLHAEWRFRDWLSDLSFPWRFGIKKQSNLMLPMRDGVRLNTTLYRPVDADGPIPTILVRTTYGGFSSDWMRLFVDNGYAVVVQNVRGRYGSEGRYESPHRYSRRDGYDTIDWIVAQSWSTDRVGTFGCSYLGEAQLMLAAEKHPGHVAMIADGAGGAIGDAQNSYGYFGVYENGVLNLASSLGWFVSDGAIDFRQTPVPDNLAQTLAQQTPTLPVESLARRIVPYATGFDDIVTHPLTSPWWREEGYVSRQDEFSVATLHVNNWYDQTVHDTFRLARHMHARAAHPRAKNQFLLIGPGTHCRSGEMSAPRAKIGQMEIDYTDLDYAAIYLEWFDYWLKNSGELKMPRIRYHLIHAASWQDAAEWPPRDQLRLRYSLGPDGRLVAQAETEQEPAAAGFYEYRYDPAKPTPTLGGGYCCTYQDEHIEGAIDQKPLASRNDVLAFESEPLERALDLVGSVNVSLQVSTSAEDTDFTVKIADRYPDGTTYNLQDGVVRLRYRNGIERPAAAEPGKRYQVQLQLKPIAYRFRPEHRIVVYVSSSNFPRLARNLNTFEDPHESSTIEIADNRIYYGAGQQSIIELPINRR